MPHPLNTWQHLISQEIEATIQLLLSGKSTGPEMFIGTFYESFARDLRTPSRTCQDLRDPSLAPF